MHYVDGYVLPCPTDKLEAYLAMARAAAKLWREHGALEYREAVGEDLEVKGDMPFLSFAKLAGVQPGETVIFAWIVFDSRAHRDEVNAKVMADPRLNEMCGEGDMPFDCARMAYGGFDVKVAA